MEKIVVRSVHDYEWREVRALRLQALQDEAARIAFVDTFEDASSRPDEFWRQRVARASLEAGSDASTRQFVTITEEGRWFGSITVNIERVGDRAYEEAVIRTPAGGIVGLYLDPEFRGNGSVQRFFDIAFDWIRERGLHHARLYVNADNVRARRAYEKVGFHATGTTILSTVGPEIEMARHV